MFGLYLNIELKSDVVSQWNERGNRFLEPYRTVFGGRTLEILNGNVVKDEIHNGIEKTWRHTALILKSIVLLPLGLICRAMAFNLESFKGTVRVLKEYLAAPVVVNQPMEIEDQLKALNAAKIQLLAKRLITVVMDRLNIDIIGDRPVPGEFYPDINGVLHPVIKEQYKANSRFMGLLLPIVAEKLRESFADANVFLQEGITLRIYSSRDKDGMINLIADHYGKGFLLGRVQDRVLKAFMINTLDWELKMNLHREESEKRGQPYFNLWGFYNGAQLSHTSFSIEDCEKAAQKLTLW